MSKVLPVQPAALAKKVVDVLARADAPDEVVLLVRAAPEWANGPVLKIDGRGDVRVVACVSPLAVWDAIASHDGRGPMALLTDLDLQELGPGILSRVWRQRVETVQSWDLICHEFGASTPDPQLAEAPWAAQALIEAKPPRGWLQVGGGVLARDTALRQLAAVRLGLDQIDTGADDLDVAALLRWTTVPGLPEALQSLRDAERDGLVGWLIEQLGAAARAVFALNTTGHAADALPLGLVCQAVWAADGHEALRARGRIEHWFDGGIDDATVQAFARATAAWVGTLLERARIDEAADHQAQRVLERAEQLLVQFGATDAASFGDLLPSGWEHRLAVLARALRDGVRGRDLAAAEAAFAAVAGHRLVVRAPERLRRAQMALRLLRWLATETALPQSIADGIDRHIDEWGWVDRAASEVWLGDDRHPELRQTYAQLYQAVADRRKELDRAFARRLEVWTASGPVSGPAEPLLVEQVGAKVLAPFGKIGAPPLLFVVIDGMNAAVAVELAERLADEAWTEYDPLPAGGAGRRRGVVAALPTITAVSRTSLFAGKLISGSQETEKRLFPAHTWWKNGVPQLFHKDPTGADDVVAAINDSSVPVVAVVVNTVDDSLSTGREGEEAGWDISRVGALRTLLRHARNTGRAVILTSDHGHVLERGGELRRPGEDAKARYRAGHAPAGPGEVLLAGPRVLTEGNRIVALADADVRYQQRRSGYHGGASLAEVTIPLLAFAPFGAQPPTGWAAIDARPPVWWDKVSAAPRAALAPNARVKTKPPLQTGEALFDLTGPVEPTLAKALFASEEFKAQQQLTARRVEPKKIKAVVDALEESGGVLPIAVVAQRAGELAHRATGFITTLQRIFNLDGFEVLSIVDDGRSVRLDIRLLRQQFRVNT